MAYDGGVAEHLAILPRTALRKVLRRSTLTWKARRRTAPIGRVRPQDRVFFKHPGGPVVASGTVARAAEGRAAGKYVLTLRFRGLRKLPVPFPVVKRDRRSWVVCAPPKDTRQQSLMVLPEPSVSDFLRSVHAGRRRLPSSRALLKLLSRVARQHRAEGSLLLWLAFLTAASEDGRPLELLAEYVRKPARHVVPFAVFS